MDNKIQIIQGQVEDLDSIMQLIKNVYTEMQSRGLTNWGSHYPTIEFFKEDIKLKELFVLKLDQKIIGTVTLTPNKMTSPDIPEHEEVEWMEPRKDKYMTLLRLAVDPAFQNKGYARKLLEFSDDYCRSQGYNAIRLEAINTTLNLRLIRLYENSGYKLRKFVYYRSRENTYFMFEKLVSSIKAKF